MLAVLGFVLAAVAVGFLAAYIEEKTALTWPKWALLAAVIVPAVILLLRRIGSTPK